MALAGGGASLSPAGRSGAALRVPCRHSCFSSSVSSRLPGGRLRVTMSVHLVGDLARHEQAVDAMALHVAGEVFGLVAMAEKDVAAHRPLDRPARILRDHQLVERLLRRTGQ